MLNQIRNIDTTVFKYSLLSVDETYRRAGGNQSLHPGTVFSLEFAFTGHRLIGYSLFIQTYSPFIPNTLVTVIYAYK